MIDIKINGLPLTTLKRIEEVKSVQIVAQGFPHPMERGKARALVKYIYDCVQRCTGVITFNNIITPKESVKELRF